MHVARKTILLLLLGICSITTKLLPTTCAAFEWICGETLPQDSEIDLSEIKKEGNFTSTIKYIMIMYGRAVADIMEIPRSEIAYLDAIGTFDASKNFFGKESKDKQRYMVTSFTDLVKKLRNYLKSPGKRLSYIQKAFHYKALRWIIHKLESETNPLLKKLRDEVENAKGDPAVAEEYFRDLIPDIGHLVNAKRLDEITNTIKDLKNIANNDYDKSIETFLAIKSFGINGLQGENSYRFVNTVYEEILRDSNLEKFKEKFTYEPYQMLMYMDYGLRVSNNQGIFERTNVIVLLDLSNLCPGTIYYKGPGSQTLKYALLYYYEILDEKFWQHIHPQDDVYNLIFQPTNFGMKPSEGSAQETYSEAFKLLTHFLGHNLKKLELKGMATLYLSILHEIDERMMILKSQPSNPKTEKSRIVYHKLVEWLSDEIIKGEITKWTKEDASKNTTPEIEEFGFQEVVDYIRKIRDREAKDNKSTGVAKYNKLSGICDLKDLRREVDKILAQKLSPDATTKDESSVVRIEPRDIPSPSNVDPNNPMSGTIGPVESSAEPSSWRPWSKPADRSDTSRNDSGILDDYYSDSQPVPRSGSSGPYISEFTQQLIGTSDPHAAKSIQQVDGSSSHARESVSLVFGSYPQAKGQSDAEVDSSGVSLITSEPSSRANRMNGDEGSGAPEASNSASKI